MSDMLADLLSPGTVAAASLTLLGVSAALLYYRHKPQTLDMAAGPKTITQPRQSEGGENRTNVILLYGTQTGTAERFAKQLAGQASAKYADKARIKAVDVEDWNFQQEMPKVRPACFVRLNASQPFNYGRTT
eukprot:scaffold73365_cov47-Prasinocladus_malaysianus.AAC.1